jgi:hypothetical protein
MHEIYLITLRSEGAVSGLCPGIGKGLDKKLILIIKQLKPLLT